MRSTLIWSLALLSLGSMIPASAQPDAFVTRQVDVTGTFTSSSGAYSIRALSRERAVASVGDITNPFGGLLAANPREESFVLQICKASGCTTTPMTILCESIATGTITDRGTTISVDSSATACPVVFEATMSSYGAPKPVGSISLVMETPATFAAGSRVYGQPAAGTAGKVTRTVLALTANIV